MFTGIIEVVGTVASASEGTLSIASSYDPASLDLGESIAVNGTCLTVTKVEGTAFFIDAGPETLARTTTGLLKPGDRVNLERALTLSTRLGGHLVQGHVDEVGRVRSVIAHDNAYDLWFDAPKPLLRLIAPRGSIAIDGISLTVTGVDADGFSVMIIPHTWANTTLKDRPVGASVNLEADMLARYVASIMGVTL